MSQAQVEALTASRRNIRMSNEYVYDILKNMGGKATAEQVINYITKDAQMTAVEGKRVSQPVYRALSEGATAGVLDDTESVTNPDTGQPNTLYTLRATVGPVKKREPTWKEKALAAQEQIKELKERVSFLIDRNERLTEQKTKLEERITALGWDNEAHLSRNRL